MNDFFHLFTWTFAEIIKVASGRSVCEGGGSEVCVRGRWQGWVGHGF